MKTSTLILLALTILLGGLAFFGSSSYALGAGLFGIALAISDKGDME